jgi:hypothetical protein
MGVVEALTLVPSFRRSSRSGRGRPSWWRGRCGRTRGTPRVGGPDPPPARTTRSTTCSPSRMMCWGHRSVFPSAMRGSTHTGISSLTHDCRAQMEYRYIKPFPRLIVQNLNRLQCTTFHGLFPGKLTTSGGLMEAGRFVVIPVAPLTRVRTSPQRSIARGSRSTTSSTSGTT